MKKPEIHCSKTYCLPELPWGIGHTCRLHPLERIATTCNLSHTLHFRGVNNTSGFPGFAARASVYLQTPLGGMPAWRIRNPQLQPSSSDCSRVFCNCSQASPVAAGSSCIAADRLQLHRGDDISLIPPPPKKKCRSFYNCEDIRNYTHFTMECFFVLL